MNWLSNLLGILWEILINIILFYSRIIMFHNTEASISGIIDVALLIWNMWTKKFRNNIKIPSIWTKNKPASCRLGATEAAPEEVFWILFWNFRKIFSDMPTIDWDYPQKMDFSDPLNEVPSVSSEFWHKRKTSKVKGSFWDFLMMCILIIFFWHLFEFLLLLI